MHKYIAFALAILGQAFLSVHCGRRVFQSLLRDFAQMTAPPPPPSRYTFTPQTAVQEGGLSNNPQHWKQCQ